MIRQVHKFKLDGGIFGSDVTEIAVPPQSKLVLFDQQDGFFCVWFEVPITEHVKAAVIRRFFIRGTGHDIHDGCEHRASFQVTDPDGGGNFVWHLYEKMAA